VPVPAAAATTSFRDQLQVRRRQFVDVRAVDARRRGGRRRRLDDQPATERVAAVADDAQADDAVAGVQSVLDVRGRQQETLPGQATAGT